METTVTQDEGQRQIGHLERQLKLFTKIHDLYNIDFDLEIKKIEKRLGQIRQTLMIQHALRRAM